MADIELIYSQQATDFAEGRAYSNPRFFSSARSGVSKVFLVGDWPNIQAAYEAMGVPVERLDPEAVVAPPPPTAAPSADLTATIAAAFADPLDHDGDGKMGGDASASDGLTKAEIIADLEGMGEDFDPRHKKADLLAQRNAARAILEA